MEVSLFLLLSCNTLILQYSQRMHSLPQFTRSTRGGELARVGAIIFEGNFTVSEKFSSEQFSLGAVVQGAFILGSNYPRGQLSGKQFSPGAVVWTPSKMQIKIGQAMCKSFVKNCTLTVCQQNSTLKKYIPYFIYSRNNQVKFLQIFP